MQNISHGLSSSLERLQAMHPLLGKSGNPTSDIGLQSPRNHSKAADSSPSGISANLIEHWRDRVRALPEMRSALIALDESVEGSGWSNAFSLCKADLEPWLSFYSGYKQSALFATPAPSFHAQAAGEPVTLQLQYEVQAIIALRGMGKKLILEPPVQINRPVEYLDLISELNACRDPRQAQELAKIANEAHDRLLAEATEKGRAVGDRLYHALLGPDLINLSKQWQKLHQRAPNAEELCCMLTTGRIKVIPAKRPAATSANPREEKPAVRRAPVHSEKPRQAPAVAVEPEPLPDVPVNIRQPVSAAVKPQQNTAEPLNRKPAPIAQKPAEEAPKHNRLRKLLRYLCLGGLCCAALAAHAWAS